MASEIIINANALESRVALMENNVVCELYIERHKDRGIVGNVYKGVVTKVLPGMQAAFVDIGLDKAGFLYVSDVDVLDFVEDYEKIAGLRTPLPEEEEIHFKPDEIQPKMENHAYPIEDLLQDGQEILVQVSKEPMGSKGCRLTSYITLPGRYLVFMPTVDQIGISRRIADETERKRLRDIVKDIKTPGVGYIVRTVSEGCSQEEFLTDMKFLKKLWEDIQVRSERSAVPALVHPDLNLVFKAIRDLFSSDVEKVVIDSPTEHAKVIEFVRSYLPYLEPKIELYKGREPIFDAFGIEMEIERALGRKIWLKSGGYIVIDQTEALVAIDVNTGRYVGKRNLEETILKTNLEAIKEIVYQLRLRNIGGIIILDFIDMEKEENREKVFAALQTALKEDRFRTTIFKISELGLVEMTRKRVRDNLTRVLCQSCSYCEGRGTIKSATTICYEVFREIQRVVNSSPQARKIMVNVHPSVADKLLDEESPFLDQLEKEMKKKIIVKADYDLHQEQYECITL